MHPHIDYQDDIILPGICEELRVEVSLLPTTDREILSGVDLLDADAFADWILALSANPEIKKKFDQRWARLTTAAHAELQWIWQDPLRISNLNSQLKELWGKALPSWVSAWIERGLTACVDRDRKGIPDKAVSEDQSCNPPKTFCIDECGYAPFPPHMTYLAMCLENDPRFNGGIYVDPGTGKEKPVRTTDAKLELREPKSTFECFCIVVRNCQRYWIIQKDQPYEIRNRIRVKSRTIFAKLSSYLKNDAKHGLIKAPKSDATARELDGEIKSTASGQVHWRVAQNSAASECVNDFPSRCDPADEAMENETRAKIQLAVAQLPPHLQAAILEWRENELKQPTGKKKSALLALAKAELRKLLEEQGIA